MLAKLFRLRPIRPANRPARRKRVRPLLEILENRWLPSTFTWYQNVDGDFNDATKWHDQNNQNGVPGPDDDAVIGFGGINVVSSHDNAVRTINCQATLEITGGTFTIGNSTGSSSLGAVLLQNATLVTNGSASYSTTVGGAFNNLAGGRVEVTSGNLVLSKGGSSGGSEATPSVFQADVGAALAFATVLIGDDQTYGLNAGTVLQGAGAFRVQTLGGHSSTVSVNADVTVSNLTLDSGGAAGGIVTGPGNLIVTGELDWLGGAMTGTGATSIAAGASLNISGPAGKTLDRRTLDNAGAATWAGAGSIAVNNSGTITNDGSWQIQADAFLGSGGTFNNGGTLIKSSALQGTATIACAFNNLAGGGVEVASGDLVLARGGSSGSSEATPSVFQADAGAALAFATVLIGDDQTYALNAGTVLQGAGAFRVQTLGGHSSTVSVNADVTVSNLTLDSGGAAGGIVTGPGNLIVTGELDWLGGAMTGTGATSIAAGAALNISGPAGKTLDRRTLDNFGTVTWTGAGDVFGSGVPTLINEPGATFTAQNDQNFRNAVFNNAGAVFKTSTAAGSTNLGLGGTFNNTGTVEAISGGLYLGDNGAASGSFIADSGAGVTFTINGTYTLNAGASLSGAGLFQFGGTIANGTTLINGTVVATANLLLVNGTLGGSGSLTVTGANFDWTGGTISNLSGGLEIAADGTLTIDGNGNKTLDGHTITIDGAAVWRDSGSLNLVGTNPTINVQSDGSFTILNDQGLNGSGYFNNYGAVIKNSGTAETVISGNIAFANSGTVAVQSGWLEIDRFTQYGGATVVNAGTIFGSAGAVVIDGGELAGAGTVRANVTSDLGGAVRPGDDGTVGELTIEGNYTQGALGVLSLDVAGAGAPGVAYDWLNVTGNVTLDGTLNVNFLYGPAEGDRYMALTGHAVTGGFAQANVMNLDPSLAVIIAYDPTDVALTVTAAPMTGMEGGGAAREAFGGASPVVADAYFGEVGNRHDCTHGFSLADGGQLAFSGMVL